MGTGKDLEIPVGVENLTGTEYPATPPLPELTWQAVVGVGLALAYDAWAEERRFRFAATLAIWLGYLMVIRPLGIRQINFSALQLPSQFGLEHS